MNLAELCTKYPTCKGIKYEPDPNCRWCKGIGEATSKAGKQRPCICIYIGDRQLADLAQESLNRLAQEYRASQSQ